MDSDDFLSVHGRNFVTLKSGEIVLPQRIEQLVRLELPCVRHAVVVGDQEEEIAVLLTLQTKNDPTTLVKTDNLTEEAMRWFRHARYDGSAF